MLSYVAKRIGVSVLTLLLIICITFLLMNAVPGSPFMTEKSTPEMIAMAEAKYGLDKPLIVQLWNYIKGYFQGDMGVSLKMQKGTDVTTIIFREGKFVLSFKLGVWAVLLAVIVGVPLGCIAAYNRGSWIDSVLRVMTTVGVAIPSFVLCSLLLIYCGVKWELLPVISGSLTDWKAYIAPVIGLSFYPMCYIAKLTRTSMLDAINQDYIRTARAKGLKTGRIIFKHALRNCLIPVITYLGPMTAGIITGGFVVEQTFQIPGLGKYFISSILNRDYPIIMGTTVVLAALVIMMNLIVDITYKLVDPRISLIKGDS
ncbi:MAG: ABC transporter permease [Clostridiales bacterium]|jgi:oligopeptide transport system permease protein|nr:ABC transporter permease [Clostridiales bacterium]